ncbi:hypothetical protein [Furfurilactobacillus entadae]|uniref:hypothetical protein n=1 Tax=Furfurilactobacillus entadae TaxID=2922307 RepID=UPI0035E621EA
MLKKRLLFESGVTPNAIDDEDYFKFMEVLAAKERDERPVDPADAFKQMNGGA